MPQRDVKLAAAVAREQVCSYWALNTYKPLPGNVLVSLFLPLTLLALRRPSGSGHSEDSEQAALL